MKIKTVQHCAGHWGWAGKGRFNTWTYWICHKECRYANRSKRHKHLNKSALHFLFIFCSILLSWHLLQEASLDFHPLPSWKIFYDFNSYSISLDVSLLLITNIYWLCIILIALYIELKLILTTLLWENCSYWLQFTHENITFPLLTLTSCQHTSFWPLSFLRYNLLWSFHHPTSPGLSLHSLTITFPFSKFKKCIFIISIEV